MYLKMERFLFNNHYPTSIVIGSELPKCGIFLKLLCKTL